MRPAVTYAVVAWRHDESSLLFWDGFAWGASDHAEFYGTKGGALEVLALVPPVGRLEFGPPALLDVGAFNEKYGRSIGPERRPGRPSEEKRW